jgi:hypothetical protein
MAEFERQHYVQKKRLDFFAMQAENGKYKTCLLDLCNFTEDVRNTEGDAIAESVKQA